MSTRIHDKHKTWSGTGVQNTAYKKTYAALSDEFESAAKAIEARLSAAPSQTLKKRTVVQGKINSRSWLG